jgi:hypothetical protein
MSELLGTDWVLRPPRTREISELEYCTQQIEITKEYLGQLIIKYESLTHEKDNPSN